MDYVKKKYEVVNRPDAPIEPPPHRLGDLAAARPDAPISPPPDLTAEIAAAAPHLTAELAAAPPHARSRRYPHESRRSRRRPLILLLQDDLSPLRL